jgi:hypothetical protein
MVIGLSVIELLPDASASALLAEAHSPSQSTSHSISSTDPTSPAIHQTAGKGCPLILASAAEVAEVKQIQTQNGRLSLVLEPVSTHSYNVRGDQKHAP